MFSMPSDSFRKLRFVLFTNDPRARRLGDHLALVGPTVARAATSDEAIAAACTGEETLLVIDQTLWFNMRPSHLMSLAEAQSTGALRMILLATDTGAVSARGMTLGAFEAIVPPRASANDLVTTVARVALSWGGSGPSSSPSSSQRGSQRAHVLVADDSELLLRITSSILTRAGYEVTATVNPFDAFSALRKDAPDVALIDYNMPGMRGDLMIDMVKREGLRTPMLLYSSAPEPVLRDAVTRSGAVGYIVKGCSPEALLDRIREVLRAQSQRQMQKR
jgi:CheY-like chemotaxis protein